MPACYFWGRMHHFKQNLKALGVITAKRMIRKKEKLNIFTDKFNFFFIKFSRILGMIRNPRCV